jgi:hypothetical protein
VTRTTLFTICMLFTFVLTERASAQSRQPYPNAITDSSVIPETPMLPPLKNVVFPDPDFGSAMVRVTDESTNAELPGDYLRTEGGEAVEWSADGRKFYVEGKGGRDLVFAFDPATMAVSSLPGEKTGDGFVLPLRPSPSFSLVDPDLIYGTSEADPLTIISYRFATGIATSLIDTRTCGVQPPLGSGKLVVSDDDVTPSLDDSRFSISEGGPQFGKDMLVVVYDKKLGCRWYNTQTGEIGGKWGATGAASITTPYLINHAYLSRSGDYVLILVDWFGWYVWDLSTLKVTACPVEDSLEGCAGYRAVGYDSMVNSPAVTGSMQTAKRFLSNIARISELVPPVSSDWRQDRHFTWTNVNVHDNAPVCVSTYGYDTGIWIDKPYEGEIFCIETDGVTSTVWRFAHDRATYIPPFFQTQPLGSVSRSGRFFLFTSNWDAQLGAVNGVPRSDVFILKLD